MRKGVFKERKVAAEVKQEAIAKADAEAADPAKYGTVPYHCGTGRRD